ncbi:hypothetical protein [Deinococcus altitudinis]|uniref:hypothetical protein n=1 Tax=Deinococcus altitudinis TaxID=468914 RepID=UPI003892761E
MIEMQPTIVVTQKDGFLVSAEVDVQEYARGLRPLNARHLKMLSFHPLAVVTGVGFSWVQPESPESHELRGQHFLPMFERLTLGESLVVNAALYQAARDHFAATDPAHKVRQVHGLLIEVTTGHAPVLLNLKVECVLTENQPTVVFELTGLNPSGRLVAGN